MKQHHELPLLTLRDNSKQTGTHRETDKQTCNNLPGNQSRKRHLYYSHEEESTQIQPQPSLRIHYKLIPQMLLLPLHTFHSQQPRKREYFSLSSCRALNLTGNGFCFLVVVSGSSHMRQLYLLRLRNNSFILFLHTSWRHFAAIFGDSQIESYFIRLQTGLFFRVF